MGVVNSDFQLGVVNNQHAILGGSKIQLCFFSLATFLFILSLLHDTLGDKFLNSPHCICPFFFEGVGWGGLDLKEEEVSLPRDC